MTQEQAQKQAQKAIYERFANGGFKGFEKSYNEKLDYIKVTETNPMLDKHMYELVLFCTERNTYSMYSKTVFTFASYKETTYEQFKAALKDKYNLVIPGKRKLIAKNTIVAAYNISDKLSFYIGQTVETQNTRRRCPELRDYNFIIEDCSEKKEYYYTDLGTYYNTLGSGHALKPMLRRCGSEDINDFYKLKKDADETFYLPKDRVDRFFVDFPNIARNCYPFNQEYTFLNFPVI